MLINVSDDASLLFWRELIPSKFLQSGGNEVCFVR